MIEHINIFPQNIQSRSFNKPLPESPSALFRSTSLNNLSEGDFFRFINHPHTKYILRIFRSVEDLRLFIKKNGHVNFKGAYSYDPCKRLQEFGGITVLNRVVRANKTGLNKIWWLDHLSEDKNIEVLIRA